MARWQSPATKDICPLYTLRAASGLRLFQSTGRGDRLHRIARDPSTVSDAQVRARVGWLLALAATCGCGAPAPATTARVVTPASSTHGVVSVPPGGVAPGTLTGTIVFQSDRAGRSKLFALDLRTDAISQWTSGDDHHDVEPAWSADGRRVAFASTRFDARTFDLAVADAGAGASVRRVTSEVAFERQPVWSADGRSLFFASERDGTQALFRVTLDDGRITRVSPLPERGLMPTVAPDGTRVAYVTGGADGLQVATQDLASGQLTRLTTGPETAAWPAWSRDGSQIACVRTAEDGQSRLDVIDVASRTRTTYSLDGLPSLREPGWSPDGRFVVLAATGATGSGSDWDLVVVRLDGGARFMRVTDGRGNDTAPSWSAR